MATQLFVRGSVGPTLSPPSGQTYGLLSPRTGGSSQNITTTLTAGGTAIDATTTAAGTTKIYWLTEPLLEAVTISGTVTIQLRGLQGNVDANACLGAIIERTDNAGTPISTIINDTVPNPAVELATAGVSYVDTYTPTSTTFNVGDRIKLTVQFRNFGTMGAFTATFNFDAQTLANAPYITFTEDFATDAPVEQRAYEIYGSNAYR